MKQPISVCWMRRDFRLHDQAALFHALTSGNKVLPIFIFDKEILDKLEDKYDRRVDFIHRRIIELDENLKSLGSAIWVFYGSVEEAWKKLHNEFDIQQVFTNHDYEEYALIRDAWVAAFLEQRGIPFRTFKDQCIFEKQEVVKDDGNPYTVFTPYSKKWRLLLTEEVIQSFENEKHFDKFYQTAAFPIPSLADMGFEKTDTVFPSTEIATSIIKNYAEERDFPALDGTSHLGIHFRFGTISIREKLRKALPLSHVWVNEIIWRDFYMMILANFPHVQHGAFRSEYNHIEWINDEQQFQKWCNGQTGYPIVDAGMRQLNQTGYMHNRVRMIVASFLTKHLLIDWRWGEAYFAKKLLDFDLSANNGGWQWAAGCGTDAAPCFRIFNPYLQTERFDKEHKYLKTWLPEWGSPTYPQPIVDHDMARKRCLEVYAKALKNQQG